MKISLGLVLILIIVVVAIISGILALVPLLEASKNSSFDIAHDFSDTISDRISVRVQSIFDDLQFNLDTLGRAVNYSALTANDSKSIMRWIAPITQASTVVAFYYCLANGTSISFFPNGSTVVNVRIDDNVLNLSTLGFYNLSSNTFSQTGVSVPEVDCRLTTQYGLMSTKRSWSTLHPSRWGDLKFPSISSGFPIVDFAATPVATIGAMGFEFNVKYVVDYLQSLSIAETGKALLVDGSNHTVLAYRFDSDGRAFPLVNNATNSIATPGDVPNGDIQSALQFIGNGLYDCTPQCDFEIGSGYTGTLFLRVATAYSNYGLTTRLLVVIPSSDFLSGIKQSIVIGASAAAGAIVVLATLSAILLFSCLRPLHRLEQRLYAIAVLNDDSSIAPNSFLKEIFNIEVAYSSMQSELMKMKSFLPQSVLRQLEEELAAEEEEREKRTKETSDSSKEDAGGEEPAPAEKISSSAFDIPNTHALVSSPTMPISALDKHSRNQLPTLVNDSENPLNVKANIQNDDAQKSSNSSKTDKKETATAKPVKMSVVSDEAKEVKVPSQPVVTAPQSYHDDLSAVNPLQLVIPDGCDGDDVTKKTSPTTSLNMMPSSSLRSEVNPFAITEARRKRADRPTLRSLNDLCVLSAKRITVAMANVVGFHQILEHQGASGVEKFHSALLGTVLNEVNTTCGVLDFVHGDRFLMTFNASTNCLQHSVCAAEMGVKVNCQLEAQNLPGYQGIRFGVSSGEALCGNFGNDLMKRFSAVGPVVHQAFTLMQQTKAEEAQGSSKNLVCASAFSRMRHRFAVEHVNYVQLPGQTSAALISTIRGRRVGAEPFLDLLGRTKVGSRFRNKESLNQSQNFTQVQPSGADGGEGDGNDEKPAEDEKPVAEEPGVALDAEIVDQINYAFETFASGDVEGARELAKELPENRVSALQKAFQVCE